MYKRLVVADHENCVILQSAVKDCNIMARGVYGDGPVDKVTKLFVEFFDKGRDAAVAVVGKEVGTKSLIGVIQFSMFATVRNIEEMVSDIVPHEYAHVLCFANGWDMGHGDEWKSVSQALGGSGEVRNNFATVDGRMKNLYEARCDLDIQHWLTGKQVKMAKSTGIVVQDAAGNGFTLTKRNITGIIRKL